MKTPKEIYISTLAERTKNLTEKSQELLNAIEDEFAVQAVCLDLPYRQVVQEYFTDLRTHLESIQTNTKEIQGAI